MKRSLPPGEDDAASPSKQQKAALEPDQKNGDSADDVVDDEGLVEGMSGGSDADW